MVLQASQLQEEPHLQEAVEPQQLFLMILEVAGAATTGAGAVDVFFEQQDMFVVKKLQGVGMGSYIWTISAISVA